MPDLSLIDPALHALLVRIPDVALDDERLPALRAAGSGARDVPDTVVRRELHGPVPMTLLRPVGAAALPAIYWIHGGGLVLGGRDRDDHLLARWCLDLGVACVSVEYRIAPEDPYPAAVDDVAAGLDHLLDRGADLGIAGGIGVAGASAGGGLGLATALRRRDAGLAGIAFLALLSPMLDDRPTTSASRPGLAVWSRESNRYGWASYLGGRPDVPYDAAPARCPDLAGLPPTFVSVGTADGFLDEDVDLARRLLEAGVPTELHAYAGAPHAPWIFEGTELARVWAADLESWLRRQL